MKDSNIQKIIEASSDLEYASFSVEPESVTVESMQWYDGQREPEFEVDSSDAEVTSVDGIPTSEVAYFRKDELQAILEEIEDSTISKDLLSFVEKQITEALEGCIVIGNSDKGLKAIDSSLIAVTVSAAIEAEYNTGDDIEDDIAEMINVEVVAAELDKEIDTDKESFSI